MFQPLQGHLQGARNIHLLYIHCLCLLLRYTGYTQKNGAVSIVNTIETAPLFCVDSVYHM